MNLTDFRGLTLRYGVNHENAIQVQAQRGPIWTSPWAQHGQAYGPRKDKPSPTPNISLRSKTLSHPSPSLHSLQMAQWWRAAGAGVRAGLRNRSRASSTSDYHTIQAIPRECSGSRVSTRDRAQGRIPAVVFSESFSVGKDGVVRSVERKRLLTTEKKQIQAIMKSVESDEFFYCTRFPLQIRAGAGSSVLIESGNVLPVKIHKDKETGKILNLVLVWADEGSELKIDVPVVIKGEDASPGLKKGGHLNKIRPTLKFICPAEHIPSKIEVDISSLDIGDKILMQDIKVHPSMKLLSRNEVMPVVKITPTKSEIKETPI